MSTADRVLVIGLDGATLDYKFARLVADPARLRIMGEAARAIGTPGAARRVVELIAAEHR